MDDSPYTPEDRQRWRQRLLAKGQEIATKLAEVLAGKEVDLQKLGLQMTGDAMPPEKRLRRFLDLVMQRLRYVDDPRFGFDRERGSFLAVAELNEVPWIEVEPS